MNYARRLDRRAASRKARRLAVKDQIRRGLMAERLEDRSLMAGDVISSFLASSSSAYWNPAKPSDVNADGSVAPNDALAIINAINSQGSHKLPTVAGEGETNKLYFDVTNDGYLAPNDALAVINELNGEGLGPPKIQYTFKAVPTGTTDAVAATGLTSVQAGQPYELVLVAQDLRPNGTFTVPDPDNPGQFITKPLVRGVFAAYTDILYDKNFSKVNLAEIQTLAFSGTTTGSFTLTFNGQTTGTINFDNTSQAARATTATNIQTALNTLLGTSDNPSPIVVTNTPATSNNYRVRFVGFPSVDEPLLQAGNITAGTNINATETLTGNANNTSAFLSQVVFNNNITFQTGTDQNTGDPIFSTFAYSTGQSGANAADRIDDVGAVSSSTGDAGLTTRPWEVFRVHMIGQLPAGQSSGTEVFTPSLGITDPVLNPAPNGLIRPDHNPLVYGNNAAAPPEISDVADDEIVRNTLTLSITSGPINASPIAASTNEDTSVTINILDPANVSKNAGAPAGALQLVNVSAVSPTGAGSLQTQTLPSTNGNVTFSPGANFSGTATFTYTVGIQGDPITSDQRTQTVTVTINPLNDAPTINAISNVSVNEEAQVTVPLAGIGPGGGADEAGQTVTITAQATNNANLIKSIQVNYAPGATTGSLVVTGADDVSASGTATITVTVTDSGTGTNSTTKTFNVTVNPVNDAPVNLKGGTAIGAGNNSVIAPGATFDFSGANQLSVSDVDAGTASLTTVLSLGANQGTLTIAGKPAASSITVTGSLSSINSQISTVTFTPNAGVFSATLTMATTDNAGATTTSTISINRDPGVRPFATDNEFTIAEGATGLFDVLADDFKADAPAVTTITTVSTPAPQGTAVLENGQIRFTPTNSEFSGDVTFTYTIDDNDPTTNGSLDDRTATVVVHVTPVNDPPVADNDSFGVQLGQTLTVPPPGVLDGDTDIDNPTSSLKAVNFQIAAGQGTLVPNANGDGGFTYTPPGARGTYTFTYQAQDPGGALSAPATVTINVAEAPRTTADQFTAQEGGGAQAVGNVLSNDTDPEGGTVTLTGFSQPASGDGTVAVAADGTVTYTPPNGDFNTTRPARGPVTFTYTAKSSVTNIESTGSVSITVNEVNDNPTAVDDTFLAVKNNGTVGVDQPVSVLGNDSFAPDVNETLTVTAVGPTAQAANGSSVKVVNGQILYTSPTVAPTTDSFTYTISDGRGGTATATVNVTVVDFVPKTVSGTVYLDANNDGNTDSTEKRLDGVVVHLTGTDFTNQAVALTATTDINGNYSFVGLKPPKAGTSYTLTEIQPVYLLSGLDTNGATGSSAGLITDTNRLDDLFALSWAVTDQSGNISGLNFGERGIDVASLSNSSGLIQEFFASSGSNGFVLAVDSSGHMIWNWTLPGWDNAKSISLTLNSSLTSLSLSVIDGQNHTYSATLTQGYSIPGSTARFRILGVGQNGQYIIRIDGSANGATDGMGMNLVAATSGAGGEGEASGGQYTSSADAVFASEAWA